MKTKVIIIDNDIDNVKLIKSYLNYFENVNLIKVFGNYFEALQEIKINSVDIIFLEINLPKLHGFTFIKSLHQKPSIIITTKLEEYAAESYEYDVSDYLIKPFSLERFTKSINRAIKKINFSSEDFMLNRKSSFFIKVNKRQINIKYDDILYLESFGSYSKICTINDEYMVHKSISCATNELPQNNFLRIHRSYTIAVNKIISIEGNLIEIYSKKIPIGRKYINEVKKVILN